MRDARDYNLGVRGVLLTSAVACLVAVCATTAGWAVQAAALPPPTRADRVAARAVAWFLRYRLVDARIHIGRAPRVESQCLQGWLPVLRHHARDRGTVLAIGGDGAVIEAHPQLRLVGALRSESDKTLPLVQLELGGCPRVDGPRLAALLQSDRIHIERAFADGHPALAIRVPTPKTTLTIDVTPRTFKPFAIRVSSRRYTGVSRIVLTRLTPRVLRHVLRVARL